jgi:hypothetical protein
MTSFGNKGFDWPNPRVGGKPAHDGLTSPAWPKYVFGSTSVGSDRAKSITGILLVFWANKVGRESGHVAGLSRPSDQPKSTVQIGQISVVLQKGS